VLGLDPIGTHSNTPCTAMHHAEAPSAPRQSRTFPRSAAPNIVTCVPMSLMCLRSWLAIYQSGDPALQWGGIEDPFIREAAVWFVTFLAVDTVLMLLHGFGGRDLVVHHAIFFACYAAAPSSSAPIITGVLIGQEVSTPFLNVFLLLRGFKGMDSALTRAFFILFALAFFAARLVLNTYVTGRAPARLRACAPPACARRPPARSRPHTVSRARRQPHSTAHTARPTRACDARAMRQSAVAPCLVDCALWQARVHGTVGAHLPLLRARAHGWLRTAALLGGGHRQKGSECTLAPKRRAQNP